MPIRWLNKPLNNFMIRLGHLKAIASVASTRSENISFYERKLYRVIGTRFRVTLTDHPDVQRYITQKAFHGRERESRFSDVSTRQLQDGTLDLVWSSGSQKGSQVLEYSVEAQDFYLADSSLPSNLGAASEENMKEIIPWASWLGLINEHTYSIQTLGQLLLNLTPPEELAAFRQPAIDKNPYSINGKNGQRFLFLFLLLSRDGDLLCRLYPKLSQSGRFSRVDAVRFLVESLEELKGVLRKTEPLGYLAEMKSIKELVETVEAERDEKERGKRKRELTGMQRVSPRLENMVDLGILDNVSEDRPKLSYEYLPSDATRRFASACPEILSDFNTYINTKFGSMFKEIYQLPVRSSVDDDLVFNFVVQAYRKMQREVGPRPIVPISINAIALALEQGVLFELARASDVLNAMREKYPGKIRLSGGRYGGKIDFVVIDQDLLNRISPHA